ncbi:MAG: alpha/beta hydrolase [Betaproteobacteria bacterium]|nr:alpha/beta hydrolase [Betaproteobacteria bacterium]
MRTDHLHGLSASGFHKLFYTDWGDPGSRHVVICVHGLTRTCRDFDFLAQALAGECRVVCPDVVGRGRSDWLCHKDDYDYPQYMADMTALIARVSAWPAPSGWLGKLANFLTRRYGSRPIYWVGTSMGGMLGMLLAARPKSPIRKLVVNDVGPLIPKAALERIATYVGKDLRFQTFEELEAYVRQTSAPFGPLTAAQWHHLTLHGARQNDDGSWGMCYDPDIALPFRKDPLQDIDLWNYWDAITCPTLALRGADSDLLLKETAEQMQKRGPRAILVEFAGIGHAPMLMAEDQIKVVKDFLLAE